MERLHQSDQAGIVPEKFRRPPPDQQHGYVLVDVHLVEGDITLDQVARLFDVCVPTRVEVVDHGVEQLPLRRGHHGFVASFAKTVLCVEDFERLTGIVGDDEDPSSRHANGYSGPALLSSRIEAAQLLGIGSPLLHQ